MKRFISLSVLLVTTLAQAVDTAYSPPVGGMTITVPAFGTQAISIPLLHGSAGAGAMMGTVTGVGTNFIDAADANWLAGGLTGASTPYYLRIKSGAAVGRTMMVASTANTATRVFVTNDGVAVNAAGGVVAGDKFELVLADTLGSLFGAATLQGGATPTAADNVWVWGSTSWQIYYYNTTRNQWERASDVTPTNRDNQVIRPDRGMMIVRNAATSFKMYVTGRVPDVAPRFFHSRPGVTFLSSGLPLPVTLGTLNLQTNVAGWIGGTNIATALVDADLIQVWSSTSWLSYYYDSSKGYWRRTSDLTDTNRNGISIPAGRPVMIVRQGSTTGGNLILLPAPPSS